MSSEVLESTTPGAPDSGTPEQNAPRPVSVTRYLLAAALLLITVPLMGLADATDRESLYTGKVGLSDLPKQVNEWTGKEYPLDDLSLEQLTPDDYVWRIYEDPYGVPLDFMVVYGHLKQTFHSPGFCLPGGGWQIAAKSEAKADSSGLPVPMNLFHIQKDFEGRQYRQVVLYCFVQGDNATPSLMKHNLNLLKARLLHQRATGALVRVTVPIYSTEDVAIARAKTFINTIYPELRQRIG